MTWAIKWVSDSPFDGHREYLIGGWGPSIPPQLSGYKTLVFETRAQARAYVKERYGYIAKRPDLRRPPHCWKMPKVVRVRVTVEEIA